MGLRGVPTTATNLDGAVLEGEGTNQIQRLVITRHLML
jgi:hypothetical protein